MRQKWGQNFLTDKNTAKKIVDSLQLNSQDSVLEIGPGSGMMTQFLIGRTKKLLAVELDKKWADFLHKKWSKSELTVIHKDFLQWDMPPWPEKSAKIVGNLPYSAGNAIVQKFLDWPAWKEAVIMLQKEVVDRMLAFPGSKAYGILSLAVQGKAEIKKLFNVHPSVFRPRPKIMSSVIYLKRRSVSLIKEEARFFKIVRSVFQQRRKTILNSLAHGLKIEKELIKDLLAPIGVTGSSRPETLTLENYNRMTEVFKDYVSS